MSNLRVKIDDFYPNFQPVNIGDLSISIDLNLEERTFLVDTTDVRLEFIGDAYLYLKNSLERNAFGGTHDIRIEMKVAENTFGEVYKGKLFITDCEFDLFRKVCKVSIIDDSYNSKIKVNREIEASLFANKSKNGIALTPVSTVTISLFNPPTTGTTDLVQTTAKVFPIKDVFEFLTKFISDDQVGFKSDFLDNLKDNDDLNFGLIKGYTLRTNTFDFADNQISMQQLGRDFALAYNLIFGVDETTGSPLVELEDVDSFRNEESIITIRNEREIKQSFIQELLVNRLTCGDSEALINEPYGLLPYRPPFDFKDDQYYIEGIGNIDKELELRPLDLHFDSNLIQTILVGDDDGYDDYWFLISYKESTLSARTDNADLFGTSEYYYNTEFVNKNVIQRYDFSGGVIKSIGNGSEDIEVWLTGGQVALSNLNFSSGTLQYLDYGLEISDIAGVYNPVNYRYTATTGGVRNCKITTLVQLTDVGQPTFPQGQNIDLTGWFQAYRITMRLYKNGSIVVEQPIDLNPRTLYVLWDTTHLAEITNNLQIYLAPTDYMQVYLEIVPLYLPPSYAPLFTEKQSYGLSNGYGGYAGYDNFQTSGEYRVDGFSKWIVDAESVLTPNSTINKSQTNFFVNKLSVDTNLSQKDMIDLIKNPKKSINLQSENLGVNSKVWNYSTQLKLDSGEANMELITNIDNL